MAKCDQQKYGITRRRFVWSAAAGGLVAAGVTALPRRAMSATPVKLRYISMHNPSSFWAKFFFELERQAKERSDGDLVIEWAGGPEVMPPFQAPEAVSKGVFDMCLSTPGFYANALPEGIGIQTEMASLKALRASGALAYFDEIHRKKLGVSVLGLPSTGVGYTILTTKPTTELADFKGRKIRAISLYVPMLQALGAATVTVAPAETYTALERGVVDGVAWPLVGIAEFRYHEVAKHLVLPSFYHSLVNHLINAEAFDNLPKDIQTAFVDASAATDEWGIGFTRNLAAQELATMKQTGLTVHELPDDEASTYLDISVTELWEKIVADAPDTGPRLRELVGKAASMSS